MRYSFLAIMMILLPFMGGCSVFQGKTPEQQQILVKSLAKTATTAFLSQVDESKRGTLAVRIHSHTRYVNSGIDWILGEANSVVSVDDVKSFLRSYTEDNPSIDAAFIDSLVDLLLASIDVSQITTVVHAGIYQEWIGEENLLLVRALLGGIIEGCVPYIPAPVSFINVDDSVPLKIPVGARIISISIDRARMAVTYEYLHTTMVEFYYDNILKNTWVLK